MKWAKLLIIFSAVILIVGCARKAPAPTSLPSLGNVATSTGQGSAGSITEPPSGDNDHFCYDAETCSLIEYVCPDGWENHNEGTEECYCGCASPEFIAEQKRMVDGQGEDAYSKVSVYNTFKELAQWSIRDNIKLAVQRRCEDGSSNDGNKRAFSMSLGPGDPDTKPGISSLHTRIKQVLVENDWQKCVPDEGLGELDEEGNLVDLYYSNFGPYYLETFRKDDNLLVLKMDHSMGNGNRAKITFEYDPDDPDVIWPYTYSLESANDFNNQGWDTRIIRTSKINSEQETVVPSTKLAAGFDSFNRVLGRLAIPDNSHYLFMLENTPESDFPGGPIWVYDAVRNEFRRPSAINEAFDAFGGYAVSPDGHYLVYAHNNSSDEYGATLSLQLFDLVTDSVTTILTLPEGESLNAGGYGLLRKFSLEWIDGDTIRYSVYDNSDSRYISSGVDFKPLLEDRIVDVDL